MKSRRQNCFRRRGSTLDRIGLYSLWISVALFSAALIMARPGFADEDAEQSGSTNRDRIATDGDQGEKKNPLQWKTLFDGKTLNGWKKTKFGGEGEVYVDKGRMVLDFGSYLTGVTYTGKIPKINYEVSLEAMRVDGTDFFCGLTVPVNDSCCSLIVGGWGGGLTGISSIDGLDASENSTGSYMNFENKKWYRIRLRVTHKQLQAWINDRYIVDEDIEGRKITVRNEVTLSKPFGLATFDTRGALRNIRIRPLKPSELRSEQSGAVKE